MLNISYEISLHLKLFKALPAFANSKVDFVNSRLPFPQGEQSIHLKMIWAARYGKLIKNLKGIFTSKLKE